MTQELFDKAHELQRCITRTQETISNLKNGYANTILSYREDGYPTFCSLDSLEVGSELHTAILNHFENQLATLQQEFDNL